MKLIRKIVYFFCATCRPNSSATVRYAFPLVFAFATLLGAATVITSGKSYIHLETSHTSLRAGEAFEIDVYVNAHVAVNAVDIRLAFPEEQIEITGIDTGASVITLWAKDPYVEHNEVVLQGGTFRRGFRGDHLIATINARAIETGLAQISVHDVVLLAGDGTGSEVSVTNPNDATKLYIADQTGTFAQSADTGVNLQGSASVVIVTDIDGDGSVSLTDISRFMTAWALKDVVYDFNGDGHMSFRDFGIILADSFLQ